MGEVIEFIPRNVNGVRVEQRNIDGFINATVMCKAHNKDVSDWLKTDDTWDLVIALADDLGVFPKNPKSGNSVFTRVSGIYPSLVIVKKGSPEFGGGSWIHPDLAIDLASWCSKKFAIQVSRWVQEWLTTGKNPVYNEPDLDKEYIAWQERYDIRIELKDVLRLELMEATRAYAEANSLGAKYLCIKVHQIMNQRIQGMNSKDIKEIYKLSLYSLLRDYFDARPLHTYAAINRIAVNRIIDGNINPIDAVNYACDMYLGARYIPKLSAKAENLHSQGRRLKKAKAKKAKASSVDIQLTIFDFDNGKAV